MSFFNLYYKTCCVKRWSSVWNLFTIDTDFIALVKSLTCTSCKRSSAAGKLYWLFRFIKKANINSPWASSAWTGTVLSAEAPRGPTSSTLSQHWPSVLKSHSFYNNCFIHLEQKSDQLFNPPRIYLTEGADSRRGAQVWSIDSKIITNKYTIN